mgnify:CR=1 FL=1
MAKGTLPSVESIPFAYTDSYTPSYLPTHEPDLWLHPPCFWLAEGLVVSVCQVFYGKSVYARDSCQTAAKFDEFAFYEIDILQE